MCSSVVERCPDKTEVDGSIPSTLTNRYSFAKATAGERFTTKKVWFYQLNLDRNLGKGQPLSENDLAEFVELQKTKKDSKNSWSVDIKDITGEGHSLKANLRNK